MKSSLVSEAAMTIINDFQQRGEEHTHCFELLKMAGEAIDYAYNDTALFPSPAYTETNIGRVQVGAPENFVCSMWAGVDEPTTVLKVGTLTIPFMEFDELGQRIAQFSIDDIKTRLAELTDVERVIPLALIEQQPDTLKVLEFSLTPDVLKLLVVRGNTPLVLMLSRPGLEAITTDDGLCS